MKRPLNKTTIEVDKPTKAAFHALHQRVQPFFTQSEFLDALVDAWPKTDADARALILKRITKRRMDAALSK